MSITRKFTGCVGWGVGVLTALSVTGRTRAQSEWTEFFRPNLVAEFAMFTKMSIAAKSLVATFTPTAILQNVTGGGAWRCTIPLPTRFAQTPSKKVNTMKSFTNIVSQFLPGLSVALLSLGALLGTPGALTKSVSAAELFPNLTLRDLVLQNETSGRITVWYMNKANLNGFTVSQVAEVPTTPGAGWKVAGIGDFNRDASRDIVLQNVSTGQIGVWLMRNNQVVQGTVVTTTPAAGWKVVGLSDFNNDGYPDIVLQNQSTRQVALWVMRGLDVMQGLEFPTVPAPDWGVVGVGNFDSDGRPDVLLQNTVTGQIGLWFMNGVNVIRGTNVAEYPSGTNFKVRGVGDFNGDGKADFAIQWSNNDLPKINVWIMDGEYSLDIHDITTIPSPNTFLAAPR